MKKIKRIGVVVKKGSSEALSLAQEICNYLDKKGIDVLVDPASSKHLKFKVWNIKKDKPDLALVLGGDGTILWTESLTSGKEIPLLGINFGSTGFLAELTGESWKEGINNALKGDFHLEKRKKIDAFAEGKKAGTALNEVVIKAGQPVEVLEFDIYVENELAEHAMADGVIIATPTGSTAYSMSAGGPILDSRVNAFLITFISAFKLGSKPLVVHEKSEIKIKIKKNKKRAIIAIDGENKGKVNSEVLCRLSASEALFVKLKKDFYTKIRERLKK